MFLRYLSGRVNPSVTSQIISETRLKFFKEFSVGKSALHLSAATSRSYTPQILIDTEVLPPRTLFKPFTSSSTYRVTSNSSGNQLRLHSSFVASRVHISESNIRLKNFNNIILKRSLQIKRKIRKIQPMNPNSTMDYPKILFFGDSITRRANDVDNGCWGSMIESQVNNYFDCDYRGFEGYNTRWALDMMPKLFPKAYLDKVEIVIPFYGHNDSWASDNPLSIPVDEFEKNYREIIKYFFDNGIDKSKIIMITPTWFHLESFLEYLKTLGMPPLGKTYESAAQYADVVTRIAKEHDIELLDMFALSHKYEPLKDLFCDGVHYSRNGAKLMFDNLFPIIKRKIEARYNKPLDDIRHAVSWDQRPEVIAALEARAMAQKKE